MNRLGPLLCPILVGRDDFLELADRRLAEAAAGRGQFLLLAGEAGIGKTRFLGSVKRRAETLGFAVVQADLAPQDSDLPGASLLDLARTMARRPAFAELGRDLLERNHQVNLVERPGRRRYVLETVDRIVGALNKPTLLSFEDLQWADDLSLEIVSELTRAGRELPLMLVGSYRSDEFAPGSILREWRARLVNQRLAEEVRLKPLSLEETGVMTTLILGTGLPAPREVVAAVHERSDGIPLHIEELLGALRESAAIDGRAIRDGAVPDTIEDAILERIGRRSPEAQAAARAGAVIGRCFVPDVLAGVMGVAVDSLDKPLAELVEHSILHPIGWSDDGYFDYRHQLLRDALYRSVPEPERRRLHARAAEFCARLVGAREVHASVHYERAGMRTQAFRTALSAAREASRLASRREAYALYARAVANVPHDLPAADHAALLEAYSDAAGAVDDDATGLDASVAARQLYLQAGLPVRAAAMLMSIAALKRRQGAPVSERIGVVEDGLRELDAVAPTTERDRARAQLLGFLATMQRDAYAFADARAALASSSAGAAIVGDAETILENDADLAMIEVSEGRVEEGLTSIERVAADARRAGHEDVGVTAYRDAAFIAALGMEYRRAAASISEGMRYADSIEQSHCRDVMAATRGYLAWAQGQWDEAVALGEQAIADGGGGARGGVLARWTVAGVAFGRGRYDHAAARLHEADVIGRATGTLDLILPGTWGLAENALLSGDAEQAAALCDQALAIAERTGARAVIAPFVVTGVRALLATQRPEAARRWLDRATAHLASAPDVAHPAVDHAEGLVRLALGAPAPAREALEAAVAGWDARDRAWEAAWARLDLAACLLRMNRFALAASRLSEAQATASRLASGPLKRRADELARLARGRGFEDEPWRPLSAREFEVARLVADGMTNAEIGSELAISPRTASAHVEHILAKLGVMRRTEIAAWASTVSVPPDRPSMRGAVPAGPNP